MDLMKHRAFLLTLLTAVFGVFAAASPARAQDLGFVASTLAAIANIIIELAGKLLIVLIELLLVIVKYNDFIKAPAVERGWILMRDFANMAFLVIFIAIAYATILGVEKYEWKRLLPKLLMVAVIINFSKTGVGIVIDAAQVLMITFVNGFKDVAAGNLVNGLGLSQMLSLRELGQGENVTDTSVAVASILAVILLIIAIMVVGSIVLMFLIRIMYLWILTVLAPLALLLAATPGAEHLFKQWWDRLIRYAFVGPIMTFWLWLSFSVMAGVAPGQNLAQESGFYDSASETGFFDVSGNTAAAISGISRSDQLLSYGISIALLIYSLMVARSMAIKGSSLAEGALSRIKSGGIKLGKLAALGVATGGMGSALAVAGGYFGGKGAYKGAKKVGLTKWAGEKLDTAFGAKLTRGAGKILQKIGPTKGARGFGASLAEGDMRIRDVKKTWQKYKERKDKETFSYQNAAFEDGLNNHIRGIDTNRARETMVALANERKKEISLDEDEQVRILKKARREMDKGKKGAEIEWLAAYMALKDNNGDNTALTDTEIANPVVKSVVGRMSNLEDKSLERHTLVDADGKQYAYTDLEEDYQKSEFRNANKRRAIDLASREALKNKYDLSTQEGRGYVSQRSDAILDDIVAKEWEGDGNKSSRDAAMLAWAKEYAAKSADEKKEIQQKIGTQLYAQKYNLYEFDSHGNVAGYAKKIFDNQGNIVAHAGRRDENGVIKDIDKYIGSADALHEQTLQMIDSESAKKANPNLTDQVLVQLGRELDQLALKNKSFGLALKTKLDKEGNIYRINLATERGRKEHANTIGGKMRNLSVADTAGSHPLVTGVQSASAQGAYFNDTRPEYAKAYSQAAASGDTRGYGSTRIDHLFALADSAHLAGKDLPYTPEDQLYAIKKFNQKNHHEYGKYPMPENQYNILFLKLLNNLGVKGIANNTSTDDQRYKKLTDLKVRKADLE